MSQASLRSSELARGLREPAGALLAAARNTTRDSSEHRAVAASVARLAHAIDDSPRAAMFAAAVTPDTVTIDATMDDVLCGAAEAAGLRHARVVFTIERCARDTRGEQQGAVVEALDPEKRPDIDPLRYIDVAKAS